MKFYLKFMGAAVLAVFLMAAGLSQVGAQVPIWNQRPALPPTLSGSGAAALEVKDGTNPQSFRVYNTFTDASNYERANEVWSGNILLFLTQQAGTGVARAMTIGTSGSAVLTFRTNNTDRWSVGATAGELIGASATGFVQTPKFVSSGGTVTPGACGTTPSITGSDSGMQITVGSGGVATTCAATFSSAFGAAPACVVQNNTDRVSYSVVTTTSVITITATAAFTAGSIFHVICVGR